MVVPQIIMPGFNNYCVIKASLCCRPGKSLLNIYNSFSSILFKRKKKVDCSMGLLMFHPWTEVSSAPTSKFFFIPLPSPSLLLLIIHWDFKKFEPAVHQDSTLSYSKKYFQCVYKHQKCCWALLDGTNSHRNTCSKIWKGNAAAAVPSEAPVLKDRCLRI